MINAKKLLSRLYFCCLVAMVLSNASEAQGLGTHQRPNIVFILVDDFGWNDVGYNGSTFYETPRMDGLSKEWMRFDNCYTPSPMCSPTRVSILTGKNPARHGVTQWLMGSDTAYVREGEMPRVYCPGPKSQGIQDSECTVGETFRDVGYETAFYGKWHMGPFKTTGGPKRHGFDSQLAVIEANGCSMFHPFGNHNYFPDSMPGDNFTDLLTDAAIDFVTRKRDTPFYLHLCHFAMHDPIKSKNNLRTRFEAKLSGLPKLEVDRELDRYGHSPQKLRQDDPDYAGELKTLDENIGRLVDSLITAGMYDNTIIILTGDNGGRSSFFKPHPTSMRPLRTGKTFLFEGGVRTPLLIHWPGHSLAGLRSDVPVTSMDFYPTLLEMAGVPLMPTQHVDGVSLVPLLRGETISRNTLYWHFPHYQGEGAYPASAIRKGDYKLIVNYHHDDSLLFNVVNDPNETNNLATAMPGKTKALKKQLMAYLDETGAHIPQTLTK
ncbi:sulfatase [Novipirellula rosea]|uniref:Sulfatase n=1 Tax=Novipirellula rosea TaxID=1031540 RepID=A0ABP8MA34_9BACT